MYKIYAEMYILGEFRLYAVILRIERKFCKQKSRDGSRPIQIFKYINIFFGLYHFFNANKYRHTSNLHYFWLEIFVAKHISGNTFYVLAEHDTDQQKKIATVSHIFPAFYTTYNYQQGSLNNGG